MSEYQYYEFLAVDRPLSAKQMDDVREFSTRADITATRFVNEYHWGNFRGKPETFIVRWFDVMIYVANWGTRRLMLGFPAESIDLKIGRQYESEGTCSMQTRGNRIVIDLWSETDEPEDCFDGEGWMASLTPTRNELLSGDLRPLYLAWLAGLSGNEAEENLAGLSPPLPPGLGELTTAQQALSEFLRVDQDLLRAAAHMSAPARPASFDLAQWIARLPPAEKDQLLLLAASSATHIGPKLLASFSASLGKAESTGSDPRPNVGELIAAARKARLAREKLEQERASRQAEARRAKQAAAREAHIQQLADRQEEAWQQVEQVLRLKQNKEYEKTVRLLRDLREVAERQRALDAFRQRVLALRRAHKAKYTFIHRLDNSGI